MFAFLTFEYISQFQRDYMMNYNILGRDLNNPPIWRKQIHLYLEGKKRKQA